MNLVLRTQSRNDQIRCKHKYFNSFLESGECSVKYGTFRDVNNCNRYYTCASFKIVAQHACPSGFSFNDVSRKILGTYIVKNYLHLFSLI